MKKDNIYLVKSFGPDKKTIYKLGYSGYIDDRLKNYLMHNPYVEILCTGYIEDGENFEKEFHKKNIALMGREWYSIELLPKLLLIFSSDITRNTEEEILLSIKKLQKKDRFTKIYTSRIRKISGISNFEINKFLTYMGSGFLEKINKDRYFTNTTVDKRVTAFIKNYDLYKDMSMKKIRDVLKHDSKVIHIMIKEARKHHNLDPEYRRDTPREIPGPKEIEYIKNLIEAKVAEHIYTKINRAEIIRESKLGYSMSKRSIKELEGYIKSINKHRLFTMASIEDKFILFKNNKEDHKISQTEIIRKYKLKHSTYKVFIANI